MKKLLTIMAVVGLVAAATPAGASIRTVGSGQTYATIQEAVNAASAGDTINVYAGIYSTNPTNTQGVAYVDKSLTIQGVGAGVKLIDGGAGFGSGGFDTGFSVRADNVTIRGFSVTALLLRLARGSGWRVPVIP